MAGLFADIILPLPLPGTFTYSVPEEFVPSLKIGSRVVVQFGRKKYYTGIVSCIYPAVEKDYEIKPLSILLDERPIIRRPQLQLWEWVAEYYLCTPGDVMKAALPSGLKIESETFVEANPEYEESVDRRLTDRELRVLAILRGHDKRITVADLGNEAGVGDINVLISSLVEIGAAMISEKLVEKYRARHEVYVTLPQRSVADSGAIAGLFAAVKGAPKQEQALLAVIEMSDAARKGGVVKPVPRKALIERTGLTAAIFAALEKKGVIEIFKKEINRFKGTGHVTGDLPVLSPHQKNALAEIHEEWLKKDVVLLHGVTSSGKTEVYIHLIDYLLKQGRQALYLVPEIALTTQLTTRLCLVFGDKVVIYHSKFNDNERVDIWKSMLDTNEPRVVIGPRSAVFMPFASLGLVIVDEEHETSYKQADPAPRYNGRDTAMVLARMHGAKVLLGSATPSVETYYKALNGRYGLVRLTERYAGSLLPEMEIADLTLARKKGQMKGAFADLTLTRAREALDAGNQVIFFLNRRGFAPMATCRQCAWTPKCKYCDVSLTYHKRIDKLICHYCGTPYPLPSICPACQQPTVEVVGYGTERVEDEIEAAFPGVPISRMDLDTTRNKDGYQKIISDFSEGKTRILVGTQMVTKGLDFDGVSMVAIVNADAMLNQPDFRSAERTFNMIEQVAGRAGRRQTAGHVVIQTRQPDEPLYGFVTRHDYEGFYNEEIRQREHYNYPPFTRVIDIYIKHRDPAAVNELAVIYGRHLRELFGNRVFGPEEPSVARVQSLYIRKIMLKVELAASMKKVKEILRNLFERLHAARIHAMKGAIVYYDVDPM